MLRVVYLKVNRISDFLLDCVECFTEIFKLSPDTKIFFICDNPKTQWVIENQINLQGLDVEWIPSAYDSEELQFLVKRMLIPSWYKAGYAHLTTFLHARDHGYKDFWNIDADDIRFFLEPAKALKIFDEVERVANEKHFKIFALDTFVSYQLGICWTFSVAYTKNNFDWIGTMIKYCSDDKFLQQFYTTVEDRNVDYFMTYLRIMKYVDGIETYYVDSLRFIHEYTDHYSGPMCGMRYCENGRYYNSIMMHELGYGEDGSIKIDDEVHKIDIGITAQDSYDYLRVRYQVKSYLREFPLANRIEKISKERSIEISVVVNATDDWVANQKCLESISAQNFYNYEVFLISTPDKPILAEWFCKRLSYKIPGGIRFVEYGDRDKIESLCSGKIIVNVNGNDILQPNDLENVLKESER